jgi:hypothetical protein
MSVKNSFTLNSKFASLDRRNEISYLREKQHRGLNVITSPIFSPCRRLFWITFFLLFADLQTLSAADLRNPEISALIAAKMREFHNLDMPGPKNVLLWDRMRYGYYYQKLQNT